MKARLLPPGTADHQNFGWSVAIDRNIIIVGAPHWTVSGVGEAYLFGRLLGVWGSQALQLPATDNLTGQLLFQAISQLLEPGWMMTWTMEGLNPVR